MSVAAGLLDVENLTGQSRFVVDLVSIPIFSAIAGLITNWTGVIMLFAPLRFRGFRCPGVKTLFPLLPRRIQVLPIFAPGGVLGFQGFIPARAERMASICVDKGLSRLGSVRDFLNELDPDAIADQIALVARPLVPGMVEEIMQREHPELWAQLSPPLRGVVQQRVLNRLPVIAHHTMDAIEDNIDELIDIKLMVVARLREEPRILRDVIRNLGARELRFMTAIGFWLGLPLGLLLALLLQATSSVPGLPHWLVVLVGAAAIGVTVNVVAIKMVFEPAEPAPRYRYLWKQAKFARRQYEASASYGWSLAHEVITMSNIVTELVTGPRSDKTRVLIQSVMVGEVDRMIGPTRALVRVAVGSQEFDAIRRSSTAMAWDVLPHLAADDEFTRRQAAKIDAFCTARLRELPPSEFMEMLYSAVEQDAWLLYVHGGFLGLFVGAAHLVIFGG
ncbi:MAG TPA: hypothetical protein VE081_14480 [Sporichthyaceae bacterium]|nr:hypothetical protein [Sporichthyaceae bacterium]